MDTPITISSTLSSRGKSAKKNTVPDSDSSVARIPVSWDSPLKSCGRESSCTPSTLQKVNNWINSLNRLNRDNVDSNSCSHRQSLDFSDFDMQNGLNMEGDLVSSTIIMSGYNKPLVKDQRAEDGFESYCRSPYYYENAMGSQSTLIPPDDTMYGGGPKKYYHPKAIKRRKSLQNYNLADKDDDKSDDHDSDEPLSPESEKKKELCSYLQLMKPTDKKTVMILQNRRSVRVKNLSIMQEKRELEKKLKAANSESASENDLADYNTEVEKNYPGLKSFDEMKVDLDKKKYKWLKYSGTKSSNDLFAFPKPTNNLRQIVDDFDDVNVTWFKKSKKLASGKQHNISKTSPNQSMETNKKNNNDMMSQSKKHKNKTEANKSQTQTTPEYSSFKKMLSNDHATVSTNMEVKKNVEVQELKAIINNNNNNKRKAKVIETNKKEIDNKSKEKKEDNNKFNKSQKLNSVATAQFLIPKPSTHFVRDVNDFDVLIKQNGDLINNSSPSSPMIIEHKTKTNSKMLDESEAAVVPTFLDRSKTKTHSLKKKTKAKKVNSEQSIRRSSFKIKLKPKKKSFSQSKNNKKLIRSKSPLISDIMWSLRNRTVKTPTSEINSFKNNVIKRKQNLMNRKENIKQKVEKSKTDNRNIKPKQSDNIMELALKMPLKDTNKNAVNSKNISQESVSSGEGTNQKVINGNAKIPTNTKASPRINSLQNLISDVDFSNLSTEHKTSLFVENINQHDISSHGPIIAIYKKNNAEGLVNTSSLKDKPKESEFYSQILNIEKYSEEDSLDNISKADALQEVNQGTVNDSKQYTFKNNKNQPFLLESSIENDAEFHSLGSKGCLTPVSSKEILDTNSHEIHKTPNKPIPFILCKKDADGKSLHKCLNSSTQKSVPANLEVENSPASWSLDSPSHKRKRNQHSINISKEHGSVLKAFYLEYNLVLCQEFMVSFWTQTALGNVLGAQNMWIFRGSVQRMAMNNNCIFKESLEMVVSTDNNVAYIELWTKEHQSDIREGPVADVFATVYFWKKGQNGLDKKVLQLENINGFADDVQYSVVKSTPKIIVSWHLSCSELESKKTHIHCYQLAADYQTVYNKSEFEPVEHYVSSLHNIEGCNSLIMGCGENKITLWSIEYGHVVATIEMSEIKSPLSTLWVKCDRGFLFTLQQCVDRELRLIAIHGMNHSWKKLASYGPPDEYDRLKGVCVENGIVIAFYDQAILCWNAQTAEVMAEDSHNAAEYISGRYVISVVNDQVNIRHAIAHLLSGEEL